MGQAVKSTKAESKVHIWTAVSEVEAETAYLSDINDYRGKRKKVNMNVYKR